MSTQHGGQGGGNVGAETTGAAGGSEPMNFGSARSDYGDLAYGGQLDADGQEPGGDARTSGRKNLGVPGIFRRGTGAGGGARAGAGGGGVGSTVCWLLTGVTLGAGLMYLFDPERGRRRRALLRDKAVSLSSQTGDALGRTARDLSNRATGVAAEASRALGRPWPHRREQEGGAADESQGNVGGQETAATGEATA